MAKYAYFDTDRIKPQGWLRRQLELQLNGLSGHLDKIWPDVRDSAWLGGNREGWERLPYWLDGFVPLVWLTGGEDGKKRAARYVDQILKNQRPDGWLCPCSDDRRGEYDVWALFLVCKALYEYYLCAHDERVPAAVEKALANLYGLMKDGTVKLASWGRFRWFEGMIAVNWLYGRTKADWLAELGRLLAAQGADYLSFEDQWKVPLNSWTMERHIVNLCMAFKAEAVSFDCLGEKYADKAEEMYRVLDRFNGCASGIFTGDENLSGVSPIQGTELCSVVELMYSYETLLTVTGERKWAERLERAAFNALPATISEDMWTHQYDQMANQIECSVFPGKAIYRTNGAEAGLFGLEPNYGCCTANFSQGWPKLARSAFLRSDDVIVSAVPLPETVSTEIGGTAVTVSLETDYPFKNKLVYRVRTAGPVNFTLRIGIPSWAENAEVDGRLVRSGWHDETRTWDGEAEVSVSFERTPKLISRPGSLRVLTWGPLVFSLSVKAEWEKREYVRDGVERKFPYCDYQLFPRSDWNYGFAGDTFRVKTSKPGAIPFSESKPPVRIEAEMQKLDWGYEDGYTSVCAKYPRSRRAVGEKEKLELIPYGCSKLRMTEMPRLKNDEKAK